MFKKFHPKEDVASSTAIKSSVQRQHRAKLLAQIPLLSFPAAAPPPTAGHDSEEDSDEEVVVTTQRKKGAGKEKKEKRGGGGGAKGGKKGRGGNAEDKVEEQAHDDDAAGEDKDEVLTVLDVLWPKKSQITLVKCREHISILALNGEPLFFQHFDGPYYPTLKVLHKYPNMLPRVGIDRGAIKFVLSGANIMCPGLTSPTAYLPPTESNIPVGQPVAVHAYGKEEALAIGLTTMSTDDIRSINKNVGVENVTYLGDDLWKVDRL